MQINKHSSFYVRTGWPTKIFDAISKDPYVFSPNNELGAVDIIGVGRVMIKAMRYWAVTLGITKEIKDSKGIKHVLTDEGELICNGDLYCQDRATLWLLHRNLSRNFEEATAWAWGFNDFHAQSFDKDLFSGSLQVYLQKNGGNYAKSIIEKEFDCFKNTYVSDKAFDIDRILEEDTIPFFSPLKLIRHCGSGKYEFNKTGSKDIPIDILLYCICMDNVERLESNRQIDIDVLLEGSGQVGRYMNLSYTTLLGLLQQLENDKEIMLVNNFGNRYIQIDPRSPLDILKKHYPEKESGVARV